MPRRETQTQALDRLQRERDKGGPLNALSGHQQIPIGQLRVCPQVFQPRVGVAADGTVGAFVEQLVGHLQSKPAADRYLDPITVWGAGRRAYVVNGHHRLAAYKASGVLGPVPVEFFTGSLSEARMAAIEDGAKSRLNFDVDDRNEGAWRLVVMDKRREARLTIAAIVAQSGSSRRTVERMRQLYNRLQAAHATRDEFSGEAAEAEYESYRDAVAADRSPPLRDTDPDEWLEEMARRWAERLGKQFGRKPHRAPEVFARALEIYLGKTGRQRVTDVWELVEMDPEDHESFLDWKVRKARGEA